MSHEKGPPCGRAFSHAHETHDAQFFAQFLSLSTKRLFPNPGHHLAQATADILDLVGGVAERGWP